MSRCPNLQRTSRAFLSAGDRVLIENPAYPNAAESLRRTGARLVPVPVDDTGWDTTTVTSTIATSRPRAAVLVPDFHNPTGAYMPDTQAIPSGDSDAGYNLGEMVYVWFTGAALGVLAMLVAAILLGFLHI